MSGRVGMGEHPTTHGSGSGSGSGIGSSHSHSHSHGDVINKDNLKVKVKVKDNEGEVPSIHTCTDSPPPPHSNLLPLRFNNAGLQIRTDIPPPSQSRSQSQITQQRRNHQIQQQHQIQIESGESPARSGSPLLTPAASGLRHTLSQSNLSPSSLLTSPALAAMLDITPLPSPIMLTDSSPGPWKRIRSGGFDHSHSVPRPCSRLATSPPQSSALSASPDSPQKKNKGYGSLVHAAVEAQAATVQNMHHYVPKSHNRNRSVSDFVPEVLHNVRPRNVTVGPAGLHITTTPPPEAPMQREQYLAQQRGLVQHSTSESDHAEPQHPHSHSTGAARASVDSAKVLPSPPPSGKSLNGSELSEFDDSHTVGGAEASVEYFEVQSAHENRKRKWRAVKVLGQGTFSKVILATSQKLPPNLPYEESNLDPRKLVAVKVIEHGPAGGADEERIEVSLKREVDILKSVSHPSIVQLKALGCTDDRALLVLNYCPGGDLFGLASERRDILAPRMVQRMFAELVGAVRYLHSNYIVHRDIKLENVLVTPNYAFLSSLPNPQIHRYPLICLTDLGLSRRIPQPPASPLLSTRCGSEDYAAPEILLGQPYDGRSTDGWALGVLLYALMEGRLPFDCPPGKPERSKPSHRIARADWIWCKFGDEYGDWDSSNKESNELEGARTVVEGLLKKVRMGRKTLADVEDMEFVQGGVCVPGGLRTFDDAEPF